MKIDYQRNLDAAYLILEEEKLYEEDYQMHMLKENHISGLLPISGSGDGGKSRYYYDISGKASMKAMYEKRRMGYEEVRGFTEQLLLTVREVKNHLLDENGLFLAPEVVYCENGRYFFCFVPCSRRALTEEFHVLTEFLVSQADYGDRAGVLLACELHKVSLEENYSLENVREALAKDWKADAENLLPQRERYTVQEEPWMYAEDEAGGEALLREERGWGFGAGLRKKKLLSGRRKRKESRKEPESWMDEEKL